MMSLPVIAIPVSSDGGSWRYYPDIPLVAQVVREEAQYATINFDDGYEKMIIQITIGKDELTASDNAVWIFPIPSSSDDVDLDVVSGMYLPVFGGNMMRDLARQTLLKSFFWESSSQLYPSPWTIMPITPPSTSLNNNRFYHMPLLGGGSYYGQTNVTVSQHLDKFGLATEILTADSSQSLYSYLESKNLLLPDDSKQILKEYVEMNYSFSISWINDTDQFLAFSYWTYDALDLGVSLGFPTEKIFFPLKLTRVYGNQTIPIFIQIVDPAVIASGQDIVGGLNLSVDYARVNSFSIQRPMFDYFGEQMKNVSIHESDYLPAYDRADLSILYTIVEINSPSTQFTDDLWFVEGSSPSLEMYNFVMSGWPILTALSLASASVLSSLISGILVYRRFSPSKTKFALLGLTNLLTIVGFIAISARLRVDREFVDKSKIDKYIESDDPQPLPLPRAYFFVTFTAIFMTLSIAWYEFLYFSI